MRDLTLWDATQQAILPHLQGTEDLLAKAASKVSEGRERGAKVFALPDLGFANNIRRMLGGFYTGALYAWDSDTPMVPVDATVNSCGVSLYRLRDEIATREEFDAKVKATIERTEESSYLWNFDSGNHFVTYGTIEGATGVANGPHLMMHSSAAEVKRQHNGLYPVPGNWYYDDIKMVEDAKTGRQMRYIEGRKADRFIDVARNTHRYNASRHDYFADQIAGPGQIEDSVSNEQHYGMPTRSSVAIGCQWERTKVQVLLTEPQKPIYLVAPESGAFNTVGLEGEAFVLFPHGLGKQSIADPTIAYEGGSLTINGTAFDPDGTLANHPEFTIRTSDVRNEAKVSPIVSQILRQCPAKILGTFQQVHSYHAGSKRA